ncbi:MAG TPA: ATP-binding protein [Candidatus Polarisedimenticolia bacterium]|nr:ATP-binding protein [Candidatus Polarisedimenticolia bacterium]
MTGEDSARLEERVLLFVPSGKDARLTAALLGRAGVTCVTCTDSKELFRELEAGVGVALLAEEAIVPEDYGRLAAWLKRQPPWSDLPLLVLARPGADSAAVAQAMDLLGNVTVMERPLRVASLISAVRTALRERKRQYETRSHLAERDRQRDRLRLFIEHAPVAIAMFDRSMVYVAASRRWMSDFVQSDTDVTGRSHYEVFPGLPEAWRLVHRRALAGEVLQAEEDPFERGDGTVQWIRWEIRPWHGSDGAIGGVIIFAEDITARKRAEDQLKEADRRKDEFLAILAHELRNPLAPIRNSLHIMRLTSPPDAHASRVAEMMERQVNHMVRLVDDLMEVSRISRGKMELRKERVDVADVVRNAVETSRPLIEAGGHELSVSIPPEPLALQGDAVRLTQVVANLLNNAAKYSEPGGRIGLTVSADEDEVSIAVRDTGRGIAPDMLPRVFDLFMQGDHQPSRTQGGLGIGLTLVKVLVEMHGGRVEAKSDGPGRGSEFVVRLPLSRAWTSTQATEPAFRPSTTLASRRVLVVDDNRDAADSLGILLRLQGADVQVVHNGADALEAVGRSKPAVVLMDIGMPGMDGYEVARRIRHLPEAADITLIALTGWGQEEDRVRSRSAGFDYHLIKPANVEALQNLLVSLSERAANPRAGR